MGALLDHFAASGIHFEALPDGNIRALGDLTAQSRDAIRAHKAALLTELAEAANDDDGARYWWRVNCPDGRTFDFCALPEQDRQQVQERYPDADVEPLPDEHAPVREAGPYTTTPLVERDPHDDRRTCTDCANLSPQKGRCLAAWRGEGPGLTGREYHPIADLLGRCESYRPQANEPDQRMGAERWPLMDTNTKRLREMRRHG